jgi:tetratricopeptide (TPR) repeat protein
MHTRRPVFRTLFRIVLLTIVLAPMAGCSQNYRSLRHQGQKAMIGGAYGAARVFFEQAEAARPRRAENLHDLGVCSVILARQRFQEQNEAAAMRELDAAISYYNQAIEVHPGHQASIEGKNIALELKGQFDEALRTAEWAAEFVGPSARQYTFLAENLEERGDIDGAFLRYRQAVAVEPRSFDAHKKFAEFLLRHGNEEAAVFHLQMAYRVNPLDRWVVDELSRRGAVPALASDRSPSATVGQTGPAGQP